MRIVEGDENEHLVPGGITKPPGLPRGQILGVQLSEVTDLQHWANHPPEVSMIQRDIVSLGTHEGLMEVVSDDFPNIVMATRGCQRFSMDPTLWATVWSDDGAGNSLKAKSMYMMKTVVADHPWCCHNWRKVCIKQFCRTSASQFWNSLVSSDNHTNLAVGRTQYQCDHVLLVLYKNYCRHKTETALHYYHILPLYCYACAILSD